MSREEETKRVIEYYSKLTNHTIADSKILAEIAISLAMIVDMLKESEPQERIDKE